MESRSAARTSGVESVLDPVVERLQREIEVELRLAREEFERQLKDLRRRQQTLFLIAFAAFALSAAVLVASTYWAVASLRERAAATFEQTSGAERRLDRLEEDVRGQLDAMETLERRLRIGVLEAGAPPVSTPAAPAAGSGTPAGSLPSGASPSPPPPRQ